MEANTGDATDAQQAAKLPIPRLPQEEPMPTADGKKRRMSRTGKACTECRRRKVRCSGEIPKCDNCHAGGHECLYDAARRDRLMIATSQNNELVALLKELSTRVDASDRRRIEDALVVANEEFSGIASTKSNGKRKAVNIDEEDVPGEDQYPASVGSNEDLDLVDENYLRSREARETGYMGVNSEVRWLKSVQREMALGDNEPYDLPYGPPGPGREAQELRSDAFAKRKEAGQRIHARPVNETAFYLDSESLDVQITVDAYQLPSAEVARELLTCFMRTVHGSFPILPRSFDKQFEKYFDAMGKGARLQVPEKWLAILNLVFAIGSRFSHLTNMDWRGDERQHLVYMTRAVRLLGQDTDNILLSAPDLGGIEAMGLLSFYYLAIGHVSRAWVMIGVAIRMSLALGLHLRNEDESMAMVKKETLVRTWWSLHSVESLLSAITGRPCVLPHEDCTVDLPNMPEQLRTNSSGNSSSLAKSMRLEKSWSSNDANYNPAHSDPEHRMRQPRSYLDVHLSIGLLMQKALASFYAPRVATRSWDYIQSAIKERTTELEEWKRGALPEDDNTNINTSPAPDGLRELTLLRFSYYSLRILITRPCLCRTERRIRGQTSSSTNFDQKVAEACVKAAQDMVSMLPDQPNPRRLYETGPWWSIVHHLMQAMTVLLLELSYQGTHTPAGWSDIPAYIKKLVRWFRRMRTTDAVAGRAYDVVARILKGSNPIFATIASQILAEDEECGTEYGANLYPPNLPQTSPNQAPMPEFNYSGFSGYYPEVEPEPLHNQYGIVDPSAFIAQGHPQTQLQSELQPVQSQNDMFSYTNWVANPTAYSNPFTTSFDQPNLLGMPDWWSNWASSAGGAHEAVPAPTRQTENAYAPYNPQHQGQ